LCSRMSRAPCRNVKRARGASCRLPLRRPHGRSRRSQQLLRPSGDGRLDDPIALCGFPGHSAGGHIAIELALSQWPARLKNGRPIERVIALSGVFDLRPLLSTPLNGNLQLSPEEAYLRSPLFRASAVSIPTLFVVGADETRAFKRQSEDMCLAWRDAGNVADHMVVANADHFSLLKQLSGPRSSVLIDYCR
jgi:pimeloyl-ACP methyl ester carboxylesterase